MKVVIEIPEDDYKVFVKQRCNDSTPICRLYKAIRNGVILPNGHGDLIDAKKFEAYIKDGFLDLKGEFKTEEYLHLAEQLTESFLMDIHEQETVVPEDKESGNADCD